MTAPSSPAKLLLARRRAPGDALDAGASAITRYRLLRPQPGVGTGRTPLQSSAGELARSRRSASRIIP